MDIKAYLNRIRYTGELETTLATLQALHYQHLLAVPLENLNTQYGQAIVLEPDALFDKIVTQRRGGFCYELNGLFYELLRAIGFQVKRISGRVYDPGNGYNDEFDHLANIVHIDGSDWLVDVGFGRRFPLHPMPLTLNQTHEDRTGRYQLSRYDADYLCVEQQDEAGDWIPAYRFTETARELTDFSAMCWFHQTSPDSYFTQNKLCTIVIPTGRITLTDRTLKITMPDRVVEQPVVDQNDFERLLLDYFGIDVKAFTGNRELVQSVT
ncbi:arylamine N-acetyltransferase family protein [Spirosoma agri]|uniref:Arylamine N-acetyltransferase n=1 Tax=Spirosoma agri TaxID=1987381 RepID=A0A6M0III1_9BACT|nr:arylamine N-acetyltransferase [Spirosoma agri]NEU68080.1 arylamine N-acetyltransferase [Spirosoma agri]